jgi:hypothetical protein
VNSPASTRAVRYEIVVAGRAGPALAAALEGFEVDDSAPGETRYVGWIVDQAALHAALERVRDLGIELRRVQRLDPR